MNITIHIKYSEINKEISTLAYQLGEQYADVEQKYIIQGILDDNNYKAIQDYLKSACVNVIQVVSAYLEHSNIYDDGEQKELELVLLLHKDSAKAIEHILPNKIKDYISSYIITEWLTINNHPSAGYYATKSSTLLSDIRYTINQRITKRYNWL